jgi:hypothetical protein
LIESIWLCITAWAFWPLSSSSERKSPARLQKAAAGGDIELAGRGQPVITAAATARAGIKTPEVPPPAVAAPIAMSSPIHANVGHKTKFAQFQDAPQQAIPIATEKQLSHDEQYHGNMAVDYDDESLQQSQQPLQQQQQASLPPLPQSQLQLHSQASQQMRKKKKKKGRDGVDHSDTHAAMSIDGLLHSSDHKRQAHDYDNGNGMDHSVNADSVTIPRPGMMAVAAHGLTNGSRDGSGNGSGSGANDSVTVPRPGVNMAAMMAMTNMNLPLPLPSADASATLPSSTAVAAIVAPPDHVHPYPAPPHAQYNDSYVDPYGASYIQAIHDAHNNRHHHINIHNNSSGNGSGKVSGHHGNGNGSNNSGSTESDTGRHGVTVPRPFGGTSGTPMIAPPSSSMTTLPPPFPTTLAPPVFPTSLPPPPFPTSLLQQSSHVHEQVNDDPYLAHPQLSTILPPPFPPSLLPSSNIAPVAVAPVAASVHHVDHHDNDPYGNGNGNGGSASKPSKATTVKRQRKRQPPQQQHLAAAQQHHDYDPYSSSPSPSVPRPMPLSVSASVPAPLPTGRSRLTLKPLPSPPLLPLQSPLTKTIPPRVASHHQPSTATSHIGGGVSFEDPYS